jgi:hypothetical protein
MKCAVPVPHRVKRLTGREKAAAGSNSVQCMVCWLLFTHAACHSFDLVNDLRSFFLFMHFDFDVWITEAAGQKHMNRESSEHSAKGHVESVHCKILSGLTCIHSDQLQPNRAPPPLQ